MLHINVYKRPPGSEEKVAILLSLTYAVVLCHLELNILCLTIFICLVSITRTVEGRRASMVAQW